MPPAWPPTEPNPAPGEIPNYPAQTVSGLTVLLDRWPLPGELIKYAGVTPGLSGRISDPPVVARDPRAQPQDPRDDG